METTWDDELVADDGDGGIVLRVVDEGVGGGDPGRARLRFDWMSFADDALLDSLSIRGGLSKAGTGTAPPG